MSTKLITHKGGFKRANKINKINFNLIPLESLTDLAIHYTCGAEVHGVDNWKKATDMNTFKESMFRHLIGVLEDKEDEDHLSALCWNAFCLKWHKLND
jgi:hypothetical protein